MTREHPASNPHYRHIVRFHDDDAVLCDAVGDFVADGLARGQAVAVLATPAHRERIERRLRAGGRVGPAAEGGAVTFFDARELLDRFMVDGHPDEARFREAMEEVLQAVSAGSGEQVRAFGEMVDLLCADGQGEAALELERLWHDLARHHPLTLLCAYTMGNLYREVNGHLYERICSAHGEVVPMSPAAD